MAYRLQELEVPDHEPFKNDVLNRRPIVEFLTGLIERAGGPFVLALDSPWGTGKTTLVRMLMAELRNQNFGCVYFNAWQVDYVTDPLVALVSSIDRVELGLEGQTEAEFKKHMKSVRNVTTLVAKRAAVVAAKALTAGALDLEKEVQNAVEELAGGAVSDIVESFHEESILLEKFRKELEKAIDQLPEAGKKNTLVYFVDEIDRCRPTFTVELLERIKHLFDTSNIVFILSLDKQQLEASIAAVYGQGIRATEYLRRFIDLEYQIPPPQTKAFVESLFSRFGLNEIFARREHPALQADKSQFITYFAALSDAAGLTLRTQERCLTRLRVVMDQTPPDHYLEPVMVALFIVLKVVNPDLFSKLAQGDADAKDVMQYLRKLPDGNQIADARMGAVIEALLVALDDHYERKEAAMNEIQSMTKNVESAKRERAATLLALISKTSDRAYGVTLSYVLRKIDVAAWIKE